MFFLLKCYSWMFFPIFNEFFWTLGRDPYQYPSEVGKRDIVQIPSSSVVIAAVCRKGTHLSDAVVRGVTSVLNSITTPPDDNGAHASSVCCCRISRWSSFARVCALLSDSLPPNPTFVFLLVSVSSICSPRIFDPNVFPFYCFSITVAVVLCACPMYNSVSLSVPLLLSVHVLLVVCVSVCCCNLYRIVSFSFINIAHVSLSYKSLSSARRTPQDLQRHLLHLWRTGPNWRRRYIARKRLERHCVPEGSCMCVASFTTCVCSVIFL